MKLLPSCEVEPGEPLRHCNFPVCSFSAMARRFQGFLAETELCPSWPSAMHMDSVLEKADGNFHLTSLAGWTNDFDEPHSDLSELEQIESSANMQAAWPKTLLDVSGHRMSDDKLQAVRKMLASGATIRSLKMRACGLSAGSFKGVCDELTPKNANSGGRSPVSGSPSDVRTSFVQTVDLSENWTGMDGAYAMADLLKSNIGILHLYMHGSFRSPENPLPASVDEFWAYLCRQSRPQKVDGREIANIVGHALQANSSLQTLDLGSNPFKLTPGDAFARALHDSTTLRTLKLANCGLTNSDALVLAYALTGNTTLRLLDISENQIGKEGVSAMGVMLRNNSCLTSLIMHSNHIGAGSLAEVGRALAVNTTLRRLDLSHNQHESSDLSQLYEGLVHNTTLDTLHITDVDPKAHSLVNLVNHSSLVHMSFALYTLSDNEAMTLAEALQANTSLRYLEIAPCTLTPCIPHPASHLSLVRNPAFLGPEGSRALCTSLAGNTTLIALRISKLCNCTQTDIALSTLLSKNTTLQHLDIGFSSYGDSSTGQRQATAERRPGPVFLFTNFFQALGKNRTLQSIVFRGKGIENLQGAFIRALAASLRANTHLKSVIFRGFEDSSSSSRTWDRQKRKHASTSKLATIKDEVHFSKNSGIQTRTRDTDAACTALVEALINAPRLRKIAIENVPIARVLKMPGRKEWSNDEALTYLHNAQRAAYAGILTAFALGRHQRVGADSLVRTLRVDLVTRILLAFFGLPADHLSTRCVQPEYVCVLEAVTSDRTSAWLHPD